MDKKIAGILNNFFDKVFVVTLIRSTGRQEAITKKLENLQYEFFFGADKNTFILEDAIAEGVYNKTVTQQLQRQNKELNSGELACALSHRFIYEKMIANNLQKVLIFEDDVLPLENNLLQLESTFNELPFDWELFYLGYMKNEKVTLGSRIKRAIYHLQSMLGIMIWSNKMIGNMLPKKYSPHLRIAGFHDCTHAYALTLQAAKKLVEIQTPVIYRSDDLLSHTILKGEMKSFVTEPKFFDQESATNSNISSEIR